MSGSFKGAVDLSRLGKGSSAPGASFRQAPATDDVTKTVDVLDSEILQIEKVLNVLKERTTVSRHLEHFQREIKERFEDIGFVVDVRWYDTNVEGTYMPEVVIVGRTEAKAFDRERMKHEILSDTLGLGAEHSDPIKVDKGMMQRIETGDFGGGHQH